MRDLLVGLEGQHVVGVGFDDLAGDAFLAAHGVEGDDGAGQFERAQQCGHGGDLVALVGDLELAQDQAVSPCPGADDVAGRVPLAGGAAQGFAVEANNFPGDALAQALGPAQETVEKRAGFERSKEAVEGVVAGDAVAQREKGFEPVMLGVAEVLHVVEALSTAQQGTQGDDEDVGQIVIAPALDTGIRQLFEVCEQAEFGRRVGRRILHPVSSSHTVQKYKAKMAHPSSCLMRLPWQRLRFKFHVSRVERS